MRRLGPHVSNEGYTGNSIRTSKYNILTFLPLFLIFMFKRVAYLYFLTQVLSQLSHAIPLSWKAQPYLTCGVSLCELGQSAMTPSRGTY